jgi:hypothetical protein
MKSLLRHIFAVLPFGDQLILLLRDLSRRRYLKSFQDPEDLFTTYYHKNQWSDPESVSGPGSTAAYTENIRRELPALLTQLNVQRMLDAPCGDYNWFRLIDRTHGPDYTGGDIVLPMVIANEKSYGDSRTRFVKFDITMDELPDVDLWFCRDCLFHLSEEMVFQALENFSRSQVNWLLTSTHPRAQFNSDITTGSFRLINLELPPYNLPPPEASIEDWIEPHPYRHLALWSRQSVIDAIETRHK